MTEFVSLIAVGVLALGVGVLAVACLIAAVGWLVVLGIQRNGPVRPSAGDGEHRPPER